MENKCEFCDQGIARRVLIYRLTKDLSRKSIQDLIKYTNHNRGEIHVPRGRVDSKLSPPSPSIELKEVKNASRN